MSLPNIATVEARNRAKAAENQLSFLWEYLIQEDQVEEAQEYIAKEQGYESHDELMKAVNGKEEDNKSK